MARSPRTREAIRAGIRPALLLLAVAVAISAHAVFADSGTGEGGGAENAGSLAAAPATLPDAPATADADAASQPSAGGEADASPVSLSALALPDAFATSAPDPSAAPEAGTSNRESSSTAPSAGTTEQAAAPRSADAEAMRLHIGRYGVNAPVTRMGIDSSGQMDIPSTASLVAWYGFTAVPGQPGNAVFAAHVNWSGARGAFWDLHRLAVGDEIAVEVGGELLRYRVSESYLVRPDEADMRAIIGSRSGPETITLITCGGEFDSSIRAYERRVIVRAERI
jgi:LPXTG-site transpeptidase (sortase) family protein